MLESLVFSALTFFAILSTCVGPCYGQLNNLELSRYNALTLHNYYRSKHGVSNFAIDQRLNDIAQNYAQYLADNNLFQHSNTNSLGENLFVRCSTLPLDFKSVVDDAITSWYNEIRLYSYYNPGYSHETGHFTQLVWASSKTVGFGVTYGRRNGMNCVYVVANYFPAGNVIGQFPQNVYPPL